VTKAGIVLIEDLRIESITSLRTPLSHRPWSRSPCLQTTTPSGLHTNQTHYLKRLPPAYDCLNWCPTSSAFHYGCDLQREISPTMSWCGSNV